jgi:hypothetical protein
MQVVKIDFNAFSTERRYDKVWFFDGNSTMSTLIQGIGGAYDTAPTAIVSSQRFLFVWFTSDSNTNSTGFQANYASINPCMYYSSCNWVCLSVRTRIGFFCVKHFHSRENVNGHWLWRNLCHRHLNSELHRMRSSLSTEILVIRHLPICLTYTFNDRACICSWRLRHCS